MGGDYVWPQFGSVCHLPPRGLRRLLCLQSGHLRLGPDTFFSCLGFIYAIYLFCAGGAPLFLVVLLCSVIVQLTPFILQGDACHASLFSFENNFSPKPRNGQKTYLELVRKKAHIID